MPRSGKKNKPQTPSHVLKPQTSGPKPSYQPSGKEVSTLIADFTSSLAAFA